jgi:hypothetical protein
MKDDLDGTSYPPIKHDTEDQARAYAAQRTSEKQCEITIQGPRNFHVVYRDGVDAAHPVEAGAPVLA